MKSRHSDVAKLRTAAAAATGDEFATNVAALEVALREAHLAATHSVFPGAAVLLLVSSMGHAEAVDLARSVLSTRRATKVLKRLAQISEAGAARAELALSTRADYAAIAKEAADGN